MHLQRWDRTALDIAAITSGGHHSPRIVPLSWTYLHHPRRCWECAALGQRERLTWYLPWVTHCVDHGHLLADHLDWRTGLGTVDGARHNTELLRLLGSDTGTFCQWPGLGPRGGQVEVPGLRPVLISS